MVCFILVTISLLVARNSPATGYEASIYSSTPLLSLIFLGICIVVGIIIVVLQLYISKDKKIYLWKIGFLLILLSYIVVLSLHIIRGYAIWGRADAPTHLGIAQNIISMGYFDIKNFYPAMHIYMAQFSLICNLSPIIPYKYLPVFFSILYILFMYLFAGSVLPLMGQRILATLAAIISITFLHDYHNTLLLCPNHLANLFMPLAYFLLIKSSGVNSTRLKMDYSLLFIIVIFLLPVFHPFPALALLVSMFIIWISAKLLDKFRNCSEDADGASNFKVTSTLILFIWGLTWISSFYIWGRIISNLDTIASENDPTHINILIGSIQYAQLYGYNPFEQFLKVHGNNLIYMILTFFSIPIVFKNLSNNNELKSLSLLYGPWALFILLTGAIYFSKITGGPLRMFEHVIIISTIFVGFTLCCIIQRAQCSSNCFLSSKPKLYILIVLLVLIVASLCGLLRFYPSAYILAPNDYITVAEIDGMDWFLNNRESSLSISCISIFPNRFGDFLLPVQNGIKYSFNRKSLPWHFDYVKNISLGESYAKDSYMVLNAMDRTIYKVVFPGMAKFRYSSNDFEKIDHDQSVDKLYDNKGLDIWFIHPAKLLSN